MAAPPIKMQMKAMCPLRSSHLWGDAVSPLPALMAD